jgi:hypothetical protein
MTSTITIRPICFGLTALSLAKKKRLLIILLLLAAASVYTGDPQPPPLYDGGPVLPIAPISPVDTEPSNESQDHLRYVQFEEEAIEWIVQSGLG